MAAASQVLDTYYIILVGDRGVGKGALARRFAEGSFDDSMMPTLNAQLKMDMKTGNIEVAGHTFKLVVYYFTHADHIAAVMDRLPEGSKKGFVFVYDRTERSSFDSLRDWRHKFDAHVGSADMCLLVGNKADEAGNVVEDEEARQLSAEICPTAIEHVQVSAKSGDNVQHLFERIAGDIAWSRMTYSGSVTIHGARELKAADSNGFSDPYCIVKANGKTHKTARVKKSLNPSWEEPFDFGLTKTCSELVFQVWDHDLIGSDDFIGQLVLRVTFGNEDHRWYGLSPRPGKKDEKITGDICLSFKWTQHYKQE